MPTKPKTKPRPVGRPRLAKGEAKGKIVPVRFNAQDLKQIEYAAKKTNQTVSQFVRNRITDTSTSDDLNAAMSLLSKLRNTYVFVGNTEMAKKCDLAIAAVQGGPVPFDAI
jgi:hypothetical protein